MNNKYVYFGISFIIPAIMALIIAGMFTGCLSGRPRRDEFNSEVCFNAATCSYYNQKNPDKSSCLRGWDKCFEYDDKTR